MRIVYTNLYLTDIPDNDRGSALVQYAGLLARATEQVADRERSFRPDMDNDDYRRRVETALSAMESIAQALMEAGDEMMLSGTSAPRVGITVPARSLTGENPDPVAMAMVTGAIFDAASFAFDLGDAPVAEHVRRIARRLASAVEVYWW